MSAKIVRTPFGFTAAALSSAWYAEDILETEKAKMLERHVQKLAQRRPLPTRIEATLVDYSGVDVDGIEFAWVSA